MKQTWVQCFTKTSIERKKDLSSKDHGTIDVLSWTQFNLYAYEIETSNSLDECQLPKYPPIHTELSNSSLTLKRLQSHSFPLWFMDRLRLQKCFQWVPD